MLLRDVGSSTLGSKEIERIKADSPYLFTNLRETVSPNSITDIVERAIGAQPNGGRVLAVLAFAHALSREMNNEADSEMATRMVHGALDRVAPRWGDIPVRIPGSRDRMVAVGIFVGLGSMAAILVLMMMMMTTQ